MSILLTILKILGIILLVIIGVVLILLFIALFLPVRYRIHGDYEEDYHLEVKAGWLCRFVYFHFQMDNKEKIGILRILGIPIYQFPPDEEKEQKKREKESKKRERKENRSAKRQREQTPVSLLEEREPSISRTLTEEDKQQTNLADKPMQEKIPEEEHTEETLQNKKQKVKKPSVFQHMKQFFVRIRKRLQRLPERLKTVFSKIDDIKMLWLDENNKTSTALILKEVKYLLLHYGPTKIHAKVEFSAGDPANTGKVLGVLSLIPFLYQKDVHITPDFVSEKLYVQGYLNAKGHIRVLHLIRTLLHCYKDKNLMTWIKDKL